MPLALALAACGGGDPAPRASSAPPPGVPPTTAAPTTAAPTAWPPPSVRVTAERGLVQFRTPSGNIACGVTNENASCEIREHTWRLPPRDPECEFDWVAGANVGLTGIELGLCRSDTVLGARRVLDYGTGVRVGDLTCVSERAGVTCRDAGTGGFFLSRDALREIPY